MIDKKIRTALFIEVHRAIEESAESVAQLETDDLSYPPGADLTSDEVDALSALELSEPAKSGLRKLVADACSYPLFHLFSLLDGATDPETELDEMWMGATIELNADDDDDDDDTPMLHDEFYESFWAYSDNEE